MERDYYYPKSADRDQPPAWEEIGAHDAWARAKAMARKVLVTHHPMYLTDEQDTQIRAEFKTL